MAYLSFCSICLIWSASFLLMKKASPCFTAESIGGWRVLSAVAVLGLACWLQRRPIGLKRSDWRGLLLIAVLGYAWPYCIQPWLVERHGSGFIGMTVSFVPFFTVVLGLLTGIDRPAPRQIVGVMGALAGLLLLMKDGFERAVPATHLLLAVSVPLSYAITNLFIRKRMTHASPLGLTFVSMSMAGAVLIWPAIAGIRLDQAAVEQRWTTTLSLAALGVFGTGLGMFLFNKLIRDRGPLFAGMVTNLVPLGAVFWGWLDGEPLTVLQVGSLGLVLSMVVLVQFRPLQRQLPLPVLEQREPI